MEDFLVGGGFFDDNDDNEAQQESLWNPPPPLQDVSTVLRLVDHNEDDEDCHVLSSVRLRAQTEFVQCHMGSLELCQGYRGDMLREIGAFNAVLDLLTTVKERQLITPCISAEISTTTNNEQERDLLELCRVCWGAIRDMTCGVIGNRNAMRERNLRTRRRGGGDGKDTTETGLTLAVDYLQWYHGQCWEELEPSHLDLLTAVLGVLRNVSHKTPQNCAVLHNCGATTLLVWRMLHADRNGLPDATVPWREAVYRTLYTLINLAECHDPSSLECSRHPALVHQLLESWGSNKRLQPMFHNLVAHAKHELPDNDFDPLWNRFL